MATATGQELELQDFTGHLLAATDIQPGEVVVDVGCGTGGPTVAAARRAAPGGVIGIDCSPDAVATARSRASQKDSRISRT